MIKQSKRLKKYIYQILLDFIYQNNNNDLELYSEAVTENSQYLNLLNIFNNKNDNINHYSFISLNIIIL